MLKTTRNKEEKQTEPSKTLVPIIRNRIKLKDGSAFSRIALLRRHPSMEQKSAYDLSVAIHKATSFKRVSDALTGLFHRSSQSIAKAADKKQGFLSAAAVNENLKRPVLKRRRFVRRIFPALRTIPATVVRRRRFHRLSAPAIFAGF